MADAKDRRRFVVQHHLSDITDTEAYHCIYTREDDWSIVVENVSRLSLLRFTLSHSIYADV